MFPSRQASSSFWLAASSAGESQALSPSIARIMYRFIDGLSLLFGFVPVSKTRDIGIALGIAKSMRSHVRDVMSCGVLGFYE